MKYTYVENIAMCKMNDKGFIYRLIAMKDDIKDFFMIDCDFYADINDGKTAYIGMTSNPMQRAKKHRAVKGKDIMMQIIASAECPTEAHYLEAKALWDYKKANDGELPTFNKQTWGGA